MKKVKARLQPQTIKNQERFKEYRRRMALWVMAYGITHRAIELRYFGTSSLKYPVQKYQPINF